MRVALTDGATNATTTYDPEHNYQIATITIPTVGDAHQLTTYAYDQRHRLESIDIDECDDASCTMPTLLGSSDYAYDLADNRTRVKESNACGTPSDFYYCYDARQQLVGRNAGSACTPSVSDEEYTYDAAGNRLTASGTISLAFGYAGDGQLTTVNSDSVTYDAAGRMTAIADGNGSGWRAMAYDAEGRLTELCDWVCGSGSVRIYFTYDGDGRRTKIVTASGGNATTTEFRYLGATISEEWVDGVLARQYVTDPDGVVVKLIIPSGQAHAGTYLVNWNGHGDALSLVRVLGDGSLEVANSYTYGTWGEPTTHIHGTYGDLGFRFLYVGREGVQWDAEAGLYLMGFRHYSPRLGRFIQPDPAAAEENSYSYAGNNPTTNIDPDGRRWLRDLMGAGGGGGGGGVLFGGYLLLKGFFTWVWRLVGPAGRAVVPTWVRSGTTVASWAKVLETLWRSSRVMPTAPTVQRLIDLARKYGLKVECNKGHWGTPWWFRHLHIGDQRFHVPVPPGMDLPFPCR
jgi:RHS repeat-associated protein